jgi:translocation and assembly module TamA
LNRLIILITMIVNGYLLLKPTKLITLLFFLFVSFTTRAITADVQGINDGKLLDNINAHVGIINVPVACQLSVDYKATITKAVTTAAQALGYYQTNIVNLSLPSTDCQKLTITLTQGPRVMIRQSLIVLSGAGKMDDELSKQVLNFPLKVGAPLEHEKYESGKRRLQSLAQQRGYFDAKFGKQQITVDAETSVAQIELELVTGERYKFGRLLIPENEKALALINTVTTFNAGDFYHAQKLAEFNQNLKLTGYFQQVVARPLLKDAEEYMLPIEVIMTSKPTDIFNVGGGFSTDMGPRARFNWQRPWVNVYGHSLSSELSVSAPEQKASLKYKIPLAGPLNNFLSLQAGVKGENDNDTQSEAVSLAVQRHWGSVESDWKKITFVRFEQENFKQGTEPRQTTNLLLPGATLSRNRSRGGLDMDWGDNQQFTLEGASESVFSDINVLRINIQSKWLRSFAEHRLLIRAEVGAIVTNDFSQVPSSMRYFAGGDQSVRGFSYKTLSPKENDDFTGGRYLNVGSVEYSYPVYPDWRMAIFADVGNASEEPLQNLATGIGIGGSWLSPIGPIRLYIARGIPGNSELEKNWRLHFSMGPAL